MDEIKIIPMLALAVSWAGSGVSLDPDPHLHQCVVFKHREMRPTELRSCLAPWQLHLLRRKMSA